ncbi:hypothetical protein VP1G_07641 [Cytospora mali]|uniref:Ribosomal protein L9 domain-containing protein n=1 Tax=Cytospora mali TaxID=578113 RepID=A0A194V8W5_CYTMA|nr:hypothetical protein VP1G_07641 [Valsa mali var. pyri (nom. inval.)]
MVSPMMTRPTCLACLRRITRATTASLSPILTQVRGKKTSGRPKDAGVVVRLLKDIKGFGKEGAIFRTERGRMRNMWYPTKKAEYMTTARLQQLGLSKTDIGERDPMYGMQVEMEEEIVEDAVEAVAGLPGAKSTSAHSVEIEHVAPNRALELLTTMVPATIVFERLLKHAPSTITANNSPAQSAAEEEPVKVLSPLERRRAKMLEPEQPEKTPEELEAERKAHEEELERERKRAEEEAEKLKEIHGSVTARDIAAFIQEKLLLDPEASRIHVQAEEIKFLGHAAGVDKVEKIGKFEIEIRTHVGKDRVEPLRKTVEIAAA